MQLIAAVTSLQKNFEEQRQRLDAFEALLKENQRLKGTVTALEARIVQLTNKATTVTHEVTANTTKTLHQADKTVKDSTWATVAKKTHPAPPKRQAPTAQRVESAEDPKGFSYVYIPRGRCMNHPEARHLLRTLGLDTGRILDVCFPAHSVLGLLVYFQYETEVKEVFTKRHYFYLDNGFDPLDPKHLADPKYSQFSEQQLELEAMQLN
ncbi:hypothetical protein BDF14DRAFT_1726722 [Spinellus fusiger]|nr:hypothetical protein BDF14DRAFT_1726722 [Spinellus fusiger]